jgi:hypothetical protein
LIHRDLPEFWIEICFLVQPWGLLAGSNSIVEAVAKSAGKSVAEMTKNRQRISVPVSKNSGGGKDRVYLTSLILDEAIQSSIFFSASSQLRSS